jgi:Uma2 family endonuclease
MAIATPEAPALDSFVPPPGPVRRFTVEEYHRLIDSGFFRHDERFELLEGWIVTKTARKPPHDVAIELASEAIGAVLPAGWRIRIQCAITTADSEPEPDLAVVRGAARDYVDHHPGPADIALIVEVAESSLHQDRHWKGRVYARAGIGCYWIVNLTDRCVEVHDDPTGPEAEPRYRRVRTFGAGDAVELVIGGRAAAIAVADLLP